MNKNITMNAREINEAAVYIIVRLNDERRTQHATIIDYREEVEHLKEQLRALKKEGEPFDEFRRHFPKEDDDYEVAFVVYAGSDAILTAGQFRSLAEAMDKIKEV